MTGRLNGAIVKVIQADAVNNRGERNVTQGDVSLLQGFDFNKNAGLSNTFFAPFTTRSDRAAGTLVVDIHTFSPGAMIKAPEGATHFRLKAGGAAIDFDNQGYVNATTESANLSLAEKLHGPLRLTLSLSPGINHALFLVFGIGFMQSINDVQAPLKDAVFNAMAIVSAER